MKEYIDRLKKILSLQIELHGALLTIGGRKRDAMIRFRKGGLEQILADEEKVVAKIQRVEEERLKLITILRGQYYKDVEKITLQFLIENMTGQDKEQLTALRRALVHSVAEIKKMNDLNNALSYQSLDHISGMLETLTVSRDNPNVYEAGGRMSNPGRLNLLDQKV